MDLYNKIKIEFKEDFWRIINGEKIEDINFLNAVFQQFTSKKNLNMLVISAIANELEKKYNEVIASVYDNLEMAGINVLELMEELMGNFKEKIQPITITINTLKNNGFVEKHKKFLVIKT